MNGRRAPCQKPGMPRSVHIVGAQYITGIKLILVTTLRDRHKDPDVTAGETEILISAMVDPRGRVESGNQDSLCSRSLVPCELFAPATTCPVRTALDRVLTRL